MPVQGGNAIDHGFAYAGMVADNQVENSVSKLNKGTSEIPFGLGVVTDGDDGAKLPNSVSTATQFVGIVKRELNRAVQQGGTLSDNIKRDMTVVTHGVVYTNALVTVAKDDPVFLVVSDGSGTDQGKFSNALGAGATLAVEIPGAKWVSSAAAGALGKISFGLGG